MIDIHPLPAPQAASRIEELAALLVDAVAGGASVNFMAGFSMAEARAFWAGQSTGLETGERTLLVAEAAGRIVGCVVLTRASQPNGPHRGEIGKMLVHSSAQRQGLGGRLLAAAEAHGREIGLTLLVLDTETGSAGYYLYRRCGWHEVGTVPGHSLTPDGRLADATLFCKRIA